MSAHRAQLPLWFLLPWPVCLLPPLLFARLFSQVLVGLMTLSEGARQPPLDQALS